MRKISEAGVETSGRADSKVLSLREFVTPKGRSGLAEACAGGNLMLIFGCRNLEIEKI
jgi:hypothetical protein